jgi:hypothetical protein
MSYITQPNITKLHSFYCYAEYRHAKWHYAECYFTESIMLNGVMLNVVMLNVVMLNVVMLNVMAPLSGVFQATISDSKSTLRRCLLLHNKQTILFTKGASLAEIKEAF